MADPASPMRGWLARRWEGLQDEALGLLLMPMAISLVIGAAVALWFALRHVSLPVVVLGGLAAFVMVLVAIERLIALRQRISGSRAIADRKVRITLSAIRGGSLETVEHCGVAWVGRITKGIVRVDGPNCPQDNEKLRYRKVTPTFRFAGPSSASSGAGLSPGGLLPPQPFSFGPPSPESLLPVVGGKTEDEEDEERWLRDLREDDISGPERNVGPYCPECKAIRKIPKRVGDCRMEVLKQIEDDFTVVV